MELDRMDAGDPDATPALGQLVEALSGDRADVASLTAVLTGALADAMPPGVVVVDYDRSLSDRMHGREGTPIGIAVTLGDTVLSMTRGGDRRPQPTVARSVRGVILTRRPVSVVEWVSLLATHVQQLADEDAQTRAVLSRLLLG
jgi:hypothetical protein